jgi:ABC-type glycerol-3-phosphate transport system substrate-binding protein
MTRVLRRRRTVLAAALPAALLAACGPQGSTETAPAIRSVPVTLRYLGPLTITPANTFAESINKVVDLFNAKGTGITIRPEEPRNLAEGVLAQVAGGDPPDLVHSHPRDYLPYVEAVRELDDLIKTDKKVSPDILPNALDYWLRNGKRMGMPNNLSVQSIYFNKALFDKNGLKTPDVLEKEGRWNFETYMDAARRITTGTGDNKIWGAPWTTNSLDIHLGYIWPMGGDLWDKEVKSTLLDSRDSLEAIQFMGDLSGKYGVSPTQQEQGVLPRATGGALAVERGGMEVLTNDVIALLNPTTFPKGHAPMPKGKAGRVIRGVTVGLSLIKDSKKTAAAWEYAMFQSGPEGEQVMLDYKLTTPWRKSRINAGDWARFLNPWENMAYYQETLKAVRPTIYPTTFDPIRMAYGTEYNKVRAGTATAAQAMGAIKSQINEFLKQAATPK